MKAPPGHWSELPSQDIVIVPLVARIAVRLAYMLDAAGVLLSRPNKPWVSISLVRA